MIRTIFLALTLALTLPGCNGQSKSTDKQAKGNTPQTNIKVNKEYDKNGNLVRFDSTYSSYYSNIKGDSVLRDSIFSNFSNQFSKSYPFSIQPYFRDFFFNDTTLSNNFYKKDFFYNRFKSDMQRMDSLFMEMDMNKNAFFRNQLKPGLKN